MHCLFSCICLKKANILSLKPSAVFYRPFIRVFQKLEMAVEDLKLNLSQHSNTVKFWLQYMNYTEHLSEYLLDQVQLGISICI